MNCPRCRQPLVEGVRFCTSCGAATERNNAKTEKVDPQTTVKTGAPTDPLRGRVLDSKYELGDRLGEGGMGTVYRARRLHIGDEVAVKVLHQQFVRERDGIERFRREARSAALIRHANVVTIHDFSEVRGEDALAYIVMELVRGTSLRDLLRQESRLAPERAVTLMRDICAGVAVAHRQGIVHRDLKPDNIVVVPPEVEGERETAKVLDFGLAKLRDSALELSLTQTGTVMGTPYYMSPEQWRGESLDARSDVYSLGAMLYEMLTASPPFNSTSAAGLMVKHLNEAPPALTPNLQISSALEAVCQRALSKAPEDRQSDAAVLARELQAALATPAVTQPGEGLSHQSIPVPLTPSPEASVDNHKSNPLKWVLATGLIALLIAALVAVMAVRYLAKDPVAGKTSNTSNTSTDSDTPDGNTGTESATAAQGEERSTGEDLKGTWTGTYGLMGSPATLVIKESSGGKWSGVLEQGGVQVALAGSHEARSRTLTFKETKVISGSGWSLGVNTGELSADGRTMTGTGKDAVGSQLGVSYDWAFSKR